MTVTPIVAQQRRHAPGAEMNERQESPFRHADPGRLLRLGRLEADVMSVSLAILAARQPDLFDTLVAEAEACAADAGLAAERGPYCRECGTGITSPSPASAPVL